MTTTATTTPTSAHEAPQTARPGQAHATSNPRSARTLSAHTLLWCWIVLQTWSANAVHAAVTRASVPADERENGEALSTAAITVGLVIIAGMIVATLKTKSTTIVSNVCTNADPSSC